MAKIFTSQIAIRYAATSMATIPNASQTVFTTQNKIYDLTNAFNVSTYEFLCQEDGFYYVNGGFGGLGQNNAGNNLGLFININGTLAQHIAQQFFLTAAGPGANYAIGPGSGVFVCNKNDIIQAFINNGTNFSFVPASAAPEDNFIEIRKVG